MSGAVGNVEVVRPAMAVAVVNYNTREHLRACLTSVRPAAPVQLLVIDNGSSDGSVEMVRAEFPEAHLVVNSENLGYGAAANQALAHCTARYLLLLNSDTRLAPDALVALSTYLDQHPRAALVGPRLENSDGTLQVSCFDFPSPLQVLLRETSLGLWFARWPPLARAYLPAFAHDRPRVVPWVLGAVLALRREPILRLGGFDESFFMYYEEVDLCYRLRQCGWQVHFAPVTTVVHLRGASTERHRAEMTVQLYSSLIQFSRKHYSRGVRAALRVVITWLMLRNLVFDRVRQARECNPTMRIRLEQDLTAWRRVLLGHWRVIR